VGKSNLLKPCLRLSDKKAEKPPDRERAKRVGRNRPILMRLVRDWQLTPASARKYAEVNSCRLTTPRRLPALLGESFNDSATLRAGYLRPYHTECGSAIKAAGKNRARARPTKYSYPLYALSTLIVKTLSLGIPALRGLQRPRKISRADQYIDEQPKSQFAVF